MTKRRRRSKRRDEESDNHSDLFSVLPLDVMVEIFLKLPAKSIARLTFVSKHWVSIIRNKDFTTLYMNRSLTRPRLLFVYNEKHSRSSLFLRSSSHEDISSDHQKVSITSNPDFSALVRGLICHDNGTKVMIGNPSTGQFITLPRVQTWRRDLFSFLGYDPVNDLYKVLCITVPQIRGYKAEEHQIFTLGPKQKWRKIACNHPHIPSPYTKGICIDGVVYYYAYVKSKGFLICFDVTSEDFCVIQLHQAFQSLVNYCGKIALYRLTSENKVTTVNIWVLQDANKQEWSKVSHLIPSWIDLVEHTTMSFKGTLSTGQLIFAPLSHKSIYSAYFLISYDPKENTTKKVLIDRIGERSPIQLFMDHVESPMVLSNLLKYINSLANEKKNKKLYEMGHKF